MEIELTLKELEAEIQEKSQDLAVFLEARDQIRRRVVEVSDSPSQLTSLPHWSGTDAVLGSLDLACHAIERTLEELKQRLRVAKDEETQKRPNLRVVTGEDT